MEYSVLLKFVSFQLEAYVGGLILDKQVKLKR